MPTDPFPITAPIRASEVPYFSGRTWLLPGLLAWLDDPHERMFLLTGGPGTGASMLAAWLAGDQLSYTWPALSDPLAAAQLEQVRQQVAAVYFCEAASHNLSPRAVAENLANQLARNIPEFSAALVAALAERVKISVTQEIETVSGGNVTGVKIDYLDLGAWDDEASFSGAFCEPLRQLYRSGYTKNILIIIDSLEEALAYTGRITLVQLLAELGELPPRVRFLITSRSDPRLLKYFRRAPSVDLINDSPDARAEVRDYITRRLTAQLPHLEPGERQALIQRISRQTKGVFLAARLLMDDLIAHPDKRPGESGLPGTPDELSAIYQSFLNRELGRDEALWFSTYRPLLGLIAVGRGPGLTRTQLARITAQDVDLPLRVCKQWLAGDLPEGPFRFFDRAFSDFLLDDPLNLDYHIHAPEMHRLISDFYLRNYSQDWLSCDAYGLYNLMEHTLASELLPAELRGAFRRILTDKFIQAIQERTGWLYAFVEDLGALAQVEHAWAAQQCLSLVLDRAPNSLVIQHALRLLIALRPTTGPAGNPGDPRHASLDAVIHLLSDPPPDLVSRLQEALEQAKDERVRGAIALGMAETGDPAFAPGLFALFKSGSRTASWAAADAIIALNHRPLIAELIVWYDELRDDNSAHSRADKQRILYALGRMHAAEARALQAHALASGDPRIVGRAVEFAWLLPADERDAPYLMEQLRRILASPPERPKTLGPWADEWLQKRLARMLVKLRVPGALAELRRLQEHIRLRPIPQEAASLPQMWRIKAARRTRLIEAVEQGILELQVGR